MPHWSLTPASHRILSIPPAQLTVPFLIYQPSKEGCVCRLKCDWNECAAYSSLQSPLWSWQICVRSASACFSKERTETNLLFEPAALAAALDWHKVSNDSYSLKLPAIKFFCNTTIPTHAVIYEKHQHRPWLLSELTYNYYWSFLLFYLLTSLEKIHHFTKKKIKICPH